MFKHLKFVSIPVENQDRALNYYTNTLDFSLKKDEVYGENRWIEISLPNAQTYFLLEKDPEALKRSQDKPSIVLIVDNVKDAYKALRSRNVTLTQEPTEQSWGSGTYAMLTDSEGNTVLISDS